MKGTEPVQAIADEQFDRDRWPFFWLTRAANSYQVHLERGLKKIGLDIPRWRVLMCLTENTSMGISEMADLVIAKLPTIVKVVQRMEADTLVSISTREADARIREVRLTPKGTAARDAALTLATRIHDRCFMSYSKAEIHRLNTELFKLCDSLDF